MFSSSVAFLLIRFNLQNCLTFVNTKTIKSVVIDLLLLLHGCHFQPNGEKRLIEQIRIESQKVIFLFVPFSVCLCVCL